MNEKKEKEIIGYYTDDGNIYCVECIDKDREIMKKIEKALTEENSEEGLYFCEGCEKEIK
jgi:CobQ-like glutamine amidotransferase family enzyme